MVKKIFLTIFILCIVEIVNDDKFKPKEWIVKY